MTQKEKVKIKAYNNAIEKAKEYLNSPRTCFDIEQLYNIFPELAESEDEKVRKELIMFIKKRDRSGCDYDYDKWLTWLEKQGEPTDINPSEFDLRLNKLLKRFESLPKEELASSLSFYLNTVQNNGIYKPDEKQDNLVELKKQGEVDNNIITRDDEILQAISKGLDDVIVDLYWHNFGGVPIEKIQEWLEKQYEQKSVIEMKSAEESLGISSEEYNDIVNECLYGESESSDMVEPKFHEDETTSAIKNEEVYKIGFIDGEAHAKEEMKLSWSEEDELQMQGIIDLLPGLTIRHKWLKSLKDRVQPKQEWTEEDISNIQFIDSVLFYDKDLPEDTCMRLRNWLQSLKPNKDMIEALRTEYEKGRADAINEIKSSWSEEDEKRIKKVMHILSLDGRISNEELKSIFDWLNSLKGNIQVKQEWTKEDEKKRNLVINLLQREKITGYNNYEDAYKDAINWLYSINNKNNWKPSEGQLECLGYAIDKAEKDYSTLANNRIYLTLKALKEELEKLTE